MFKLSVSLLVLALSSSVFGLAVRQVDPSTDLLPSSSDVITSIVTSTSLADDATVTVTGAPTTVIDSSTSIGVPTITPTATDSTPVPTSTDVPSTSGCTKTYTVVEGDTCWGISQSQQVPSGQLATLNAASVNADCTNLQVGQELCLEDATNTCSTPYTVADGDYCEQIAETNSISLDSFYSLNPSVDSGCSNLYTGSTICLGSSNSTIPSPSDTVISSTPVPTGSSTTISDLFPTASANTTGSSLTSLPSTTATGTSTSLTTDSTSI